MTSKKDIKTRIRAVQNTQKVTKAMKLISIIKSKQLQNLVNNAKEYNQQIASLLQKTLAQLESDKTESNKLPAILQPKTQKNAAHCLIIISSDRGLCGPYNSALFKALKAHIQTIQKPIKLILFGNKAISYAQRNLEQCEIIQKYSHLPVNPPDSIASEVFAQVQNSYIEGEIDTLEIFYSRYISMIKSEIKSMRLLPFLVSKPLVQKNSTLKEIVFEPSPLELLRTLIPLYSQNQIYQALLSGRASELAHRVNAMTAATDNAKALINQLTLTFNKARQASITQEISEIVAGAESIA